MRIQMKKNQINLFLTLLLTISASWSMAQAPKLSPQRKQAIDSLALEKVRDLSKYISIIGNKAPKKVI